MKYLDLIRNASRQLKKAGVHDPETDARELFYEAFHMDKKTYLLCMREEADEENSKEYERLLAMRKKRIPLQQILGHTGFMGLDFLVDENVLAPRQDTELLVEKAKAHLVPGMELLDLCTGSGCVLISLMRGTDRVEGTGVDISKKALDIARQNAARNFVHPRLIRSDLFAEIPRSKSFDIITANPPYIPTDIIKELMPEVRDHEPAAALDGDADGLKYYRLIIKDAPDYLKSGGHLMVEIGIGQKAAVETLFKERGFSNVKCFKDYSYNDRVITGQYKRGAMYV